jgi:hypothetical protein
MIFEDYFATAKLGANQPNPTIFGYRGFGPASNFPGAPRTAEPETRYDDEIMCCISVVAVLVQTPLTNGRREPFTEMDFQASHRIRATQQHPAMRDTKPSAIDRPTIPPPDGLDQRFSDRRHSTRLMTPPVRLLQTTVETRKDLFIPRRDPPTCGLARWTC